MYSERELLELAEKSGKNDLAYLIKAKEEAKRRMSEEATPTNIRAFDKAREAVEAEVGKLQQPTAAPLALAFKTQLAAVDYLKAQGFKVGKSKFNADAKAGRVAATPEGHFEASALLAYAAVHLEPLARAEHAASINATASKLSADARLKEIQAERHQLKLEKERGALMLKADHEAQLSLRAQFFKSEIEAFGERELPALIQLVGGREDALAEALTWWRERTAQLMDSWSQDREFVVDEDDDFAPGGDAPGGEASGGEEGGGLW